jgi:hypothetical protein
MSLPLQPPLAPAWRLIVDLARILDGEHVPALPRRRRQHRPMRHHFLSRDRLIVQKAPQPHLFRPIVPKLADTHFLPLAHPLHEQCAVLLQPSVTEVSDPRVHHRTPPNRDGTQNHATLAPRKRKIAPPKRKRTATSMTRTATSVLRLARLRGRVREGARSLAPS